MPRLTNETLSQLLAHLGFEPGEVAKTSYRQWRHPVSGCTLVLPANKIGEAPRPADVVGIKAQLSFQGHLDEKAFDLFVSDGVLPATSVTSN